MMVAQNKRTPKTKPVKRKPRDPFLAAILKAAREAEERGDKDVGERFRMIAKGK